MARKTGQPRDQYRPFDTPIEDMIAQDNQVRVVDAFVDMLDLEKLGFRAVKANRMGASSYDPADMAKLYFYSYLNRIRSSRMIERECHRNIEVMWLIGGLAPSQHTISSFRTLKETDKVTGEVLFDHRKALVGVFRAFNRFLDKQGLFGKTTFAIDGTKIAAQNSKKKHLSADKLARKLERVDNRIEEYFEELDAADLDTPVREWPADKLAVAIALEALDDNRNQLLAQQEMLKKAMEADPTVTQICFTDPDARMLPINNEGMMQIAYNVQSTVDDKHCLIADFSVENQKDLYLLSKMAKSVKAEYSIGDGMEVLADKGYCSGKGIHECTEAGIVTYVAVPEQSFGDRPKGFRKTDFNYDEGKDLYVCPANKELATSGSWHEKRGRQGHLQSRYKLYRSSFTVCSECPFKEKCLSKANIEQRHGRTIERSEYEQDYLDNKKRVLLNREKYKRRQAIVEHPFGTIKRSWGAYFTLVKRLDKVAGEMAIVFSCYNLRRAMSILGVIDLIKALKSRFLPETAFLSPRSGTFPGTVIFCSPKYATLKTNLVAFGIAA